MIAHLRAAARHVELAVMVTAALLLATAGAFLGALGDRSTTDGPLDDPPPTKPTGAR